MIKIDCTKKNCSIKYEYAGTEILGLEIEVEIKKKSEIELAMAGIESNSFYELYFLSFKIKAILKQVLCIEKNKVTFFFDSCGKPEKISKENLSEKKKNAKKSIRKQND